jgi:hypothetical protein
MRRILPFLSCVLALTSSPAQAAWYQVEVIVFETINPDADGEFWNGSPGLPDTAYSTDLAMSPTDVALPDGGSDLIPYFALDASRHRLEGVFHTLRLTREYRPLLHVAWQQPGEGTVAGRQVHIMRLREPAAAPAADAGLSVPVDAIIDGVMQLRVGRFLHVALDLAYFPRPAAIPGAVPVAPATEYMRMRERRKVLLNDLNYFDHPLFGVLVQVSRLQPPGESRAGGP